MLEAMRRGQRWIMAIVIIGVGFVFVVFVGSGAPTGGSRGAVVVEVDGRTFEPRDLDRVRQRQDEEYRRTLGDAYDPEAARDQLDQIAAQILLGQALRAREAEALGLVVSDDEIRDQVRRYFPGATDENGRLRADILRDFAEREFGTESRFVEMVRMDLLARKLSELFRDSLGATVQEARESLLHRRTELSLAYVALDTRTPIHEVEIPAGAVDEFLRVDEARVRALYDERSQEYDVEEAVRARHLLIRLNEAATEQEVEEARSRARQALDRIRAGEEFADVAASVSEDPNTKEQGGDLGFVTRGGQLAEALEQVAFSLEPGQTSEPVQTSAGIHLLQVGERRPAGRTPFEEVRVELAREILLEEEAARQAREAADALAAAIRGGASLVDAAREAGVPIERPDPVRRRPDGYVPGLGAAPELLLTAFTLSPESPSSAEIFEVGNKLVLAQLLERTEPSEEELEAELPAEQERLRQSQLALLPAEWLDERRSELADAGKISLDLSLLR